MPEKTTAVLDLAAEISGKSTTHEQVKMPSHVTVEHTSACNLRCFFCEHHREEAPPKAGRMSETLLHKIETELLPDATTVSCTVSGEPFTDRRLAGVVRMLKGHAGKVLAVVTNGLLMNPAKMQVFAGLESPLYVSVSVDSVDPRVYAEIRRGSDHTTVMENIRLFRTRAQGLEIREVHLGISAVLMRDTVDGIPALIRFAADCGIETVGLAHITVFEARDLPRSLFHRKAECNAVLAEAHELARANNIKLYAPPPFATAPHEIDAYYDSPRPACPYLAGRVYINLNGEVEMCCRKGRPKTGNMFGQSFVSIWNGEVYGQYRYRYATGDPMPICRDCFVIETYKPYLLEIKPFVLL